MMAGRDVVIIGAPRSGTNMLRDVLTGLPGFTTWACDEINLTWRHGNRDHPDDELDARPRDAGRSGATSARSSTGSGGVRRRPGRREDLRQLAAGRVRPRRPSRGPLRPHHPRRLRRRRLSAMERWHAPFDAAYTAAKLRYAPPGDLALLRAAVRRRTAGASAATARPADRARVVGSQAARLARADPERCPSTRSALTQWVRCVDLAERGLAGIPTEQVHRVALRGVRRRPDAGLRDLLDFARRRRRLRRGRRGRRLRLERRQGTGGALGRAARSAFAAIAGPTLERLGYDA